MSGVQGNRPPGYGVPSQIVPPTAGTQACMPGTPRASQVKNPIPAPRSLQLTSMEAVNPPRHRERLSGPAADPRQVAMSEALDELLLPDLVDIAQEYAVDVQKLEMHIARARLSKEIPRGQALDAYVKYWGEAVPKEHLPSLMKFSLGDGLENLKTGIPVVMSSGSRGVLEITREDSGQVLKARVMVPDRQACFSEPQKHEWYFMGHGFPERRHVELRDGDAVYVEPWILESSYATGLSQEAIALGEQAFPARRYVRLGDESREFLMLHDPDPMDRPTDFTHVTHLAEDDFDLPLQDLCLTALRTPPPNVKDDKGIAVAKPEPQSWTDDAIRRELSIAVDRADRSGAGKLQLPFAPGQEVYYRGTDRANSLRLKIFPKSEPGYLKLFVPGTGIPILERLSGPKNVQSVFDSSRASTGASKKGVMYSVPLSALVVHERESKFGPGAAKADSRVGDPFTPSSESILKLGTTAPPDKPLDGKKSP